MTPEHRYLNLTSDKLVSERGHGERRVSWTNAAAATQVDKGKGGGTLQSNGLATPESTPGPELQRIAADQLRQSIEISELEKVLGIKVDRRLDQVEEIKKIYREKAPIAAKNEGDWSGK